MLYEVITAPVQAKGFGTPTPREHRRDIGTAGFQDGGDVLPQNPLFSPTNIPAGRLIHQQHLTVAVNSENRRANAVEDGLEPGKKGSRIAGKNPVQRRTADKPDHLLLFHDKPIP